MVPVFQNFQQKLRAARPCPCDYDKKYEKGGGFMRELPAFLRQLLHNGWFWVAVAAGAIAGSLGWLLYMRL